MPAMEVADFNSKDDDKTGEGSRTHRLAANPRLP
jgi:hypothetical protein